MSQKMISSYCWTDGTPVPVTRHPTLHIRYTLNQYGMYWVERVWTGLSFASVILLGPSLSAVSMTPKALDAFLAEMATAFACGNGPSGALRMERVPHKYTGEGDCVL